ncbi:MAG: tetratricopeptide repeat protein [Fulvivirga sp.]|nr:tetratricopeptide repeat protein [Fulvivirga sp.]
MNKFTFVFIFFLQALVSTAQHTTALDLLVKAERTLAAGDTVKALEQFTNILQTHPQNYAAIMRLAEIHFSDKKYSKSVQYLYLGIDIVERFLEQQEVKIEKNKKVFTPGQLHRAQDTRDRYKRDLASLYHLLGMNYNRQKKYRQAISHFQTALKLHQKSSTYVDLALAYFQTQNHAAGVSALHQAIAQDSTFSKAYYNLGNFYNRSEQTDSAVYYYQQALRIDKDLKWAHLYLARQYEKLGKINQAIEALTEFIAEDSSKIEPYFRRAFLYTNQGNFEKAIEDWDRVLLLNDNLADAFRNRGLTHFYRESYELALQDFDKALNIEPGEPYTLINRAYSKYLTGRADKALEDVNKGINNLPRYHLGYYVRALINLELKKKKKACRDVNRALELGMSEGEITRKLKRKCF